MDIEMTTLDVYLTEETETAQAIVAAAQAFVEDHAAWTVAAEQWAEQWTDALFRPFTLWEVTYTVTHPTPNAPTETTVTLDDPETIAAMGVPACVRSVTKWGEVEELIIGSFLHARPLVITEANPRQPIPYARTFTAGGQFFVNLPPGSDLMPMDPAPKRPELSFTAFIMTAVPNWEEHFPYFAVDFNDLNAPSIYAIADMDVATFMDRFA